MYINHPAPYLILRRIRVTIAPWKSNKYYIFQVSVVLVIQHDMRMRRIILSPVACLALPYTST
jgi:hypothetical protein